MRLHDDIPKTPASFVTHMNFANALQRGYRAPNHYSVIDKNELQNIGSRHEVVVHNARLLNPKPTLDSHGFQLVHAPHSFDLMDTNVVVNEFYAHCRQVLKQVTGCSSVAGTSTAMESEENPENAESNLPQMAAPELTLAGFIRICVLWLRMPSRKSSLREGISKASISGGASRRESWCRRCRFASAT